MEHLFKISSEDQIDKVAEDFLPLLKNHKVVAFYGEMGAGKTTFIKSLCRRMGVAGHVTSPSFAIVNEYAAQDGKVIFHFDFYRLKNVEEVFDMGYEDYFFSNHICLIEWPEKVADFLPSDRLDVFITADINGKRTLKVSG
ncbi:MAG: tRNA (adenosine(37)-N6)-threonylcarbamoyltransferase complex ATPase subunit type 1 TsaE [Bacteroidota bacterium]